MSTNAVIQIEGSKLEVYKHWDGNPEATLPWLKSFNEYFFKYRESDPDYKIAQLLRSSSKDANKFYLDESTTTGWGITEKGVNSWDYLYTLKADGSVEVQ